MSQDQVTTDGGQTRLTAIARNIDLVLYKSWKASTEREVLTTKRLLFLTWQGWERSRQQELFDVEFQDGIGRPITEPPAVVNVPGYLSAEHYIAMFPLPPENDPAVRTQSMRMKYGFGSGELVAGRNWISFLIAGAILLIAIAVVGYLLVPLLLA
jgi:hypothetical protein